MKIITKILGYILSILFVILLLPFAMEECLKYSSSLGFFVGVYLKYREMRKS